MVVPGGPGQRPSTGQLLEAITACGAAEVIVLPNDADSVRVAEIAASTAEADLEGAIRVAVIPTQAQVPGSPRSPSTSPAAPSTRTSSR